MQDALSNHLRMAATSVERGQIPACDPNEVIKDGYEVAARAVCNKMGSDGHTEWRRKERVSVGKPVTTITLEDGTVKDVVSYVGDRRATYRATNNRLSLNNNDDNSDDEEDDDVVEVSPPVNVATKKKRSNKLYPDGVPKRRVIIPDRAWGIGPQNIHRPVITTSMSTASTVFQTPVSSATNGVFRSEDQSPSAAMLSHVVLRAASSSFSG